MSQLESLLSFLHNVLCVSEQDCESFLRFRPTITNQRKANHGIPTTTDSTGFCRQDTTGSPIGTHDDGTAPVTVAPCEDWDDFDIFQMLDQQFLDPSWLEDTQV